MSHEVLMPQLGMAQDSAVIVSWNKSVGDAVSIGEFLFEVETDKAVMEVESRYNGFVTAIIGVAGSEFPVGDVIAMIAPSMDSTGSTGASELASESPADIVDAVSAESESAGSVVQTQAVEERGPLTESVDPNSKADVSQILASPKARRLAWERQVDLQMVLDSGASEPLHALDIPSSNMQTLGASAMQSAASPVVLHATCDRGGLDSFIKWSRNEFDSEDGFSISFQQTLAAFFHGCMPMDARTGSGIVRVSDLEGVHRFWKVSGLGLSSVSEIDQADKWDLEILDFSASSIVDLQPSGLLGSPTLMICGNLDDSTADRDGLVTLRLFFSPKEVTLADAANCLQGVSKRMSNPLLHLI